jgi:hypothetical protein
MKLEEEEMGSEPKLFFCFPAQPELVCKTLFKLLFHIFLFGTAVTISTTI